jgi:hypothetical protein
LLKLAFEVVEIDRLGDELAGTAPALFVSVGRNHDHRKFGVTSLDLLQ